VDLFRSGKLAAIPGFSCSQMGKKFKGILTVHGPFFPIRKLEGLVLKKL